MPSHHKPSAKNHWVVDDAMQFVLAPGLCLFLGQRSIAISFDCRCVPRIITNYRIQNLQALCRLPAARGRWDVYRHVMISFVSAFAMRATLDSLIQVTLRRLAMARAGWRLSDRGL